MKVIYKKPILEKISLAIKEAEDSGGEIDCIELSPREMQELSDHDYWARSVDEEVEQHWKDGSFLVFGVKCVVAKADESDE